MRWRAFVAIGGIGVACKGDPAVGGGSTTGTAGSESSSIDGGSSGGAVDSTTSTDGTSGAATSSSATAADSTDSSATFSVEYCGNGVVDPGEDCDDDNNIDGDACSATCTNLFEIAWTVSVDGGAAGRDRASAVAIGATGDVWVLGSRTSADAPLDVWLQQYSPDGVAGWSLTWDGVDGSSDQGADLTWMGPDLAVVGSSASEASGADILVMRVDPGARAVVWAQTFDGPGSGPDVFDDQDIASAVALDPQGNIVVTGHVAVDGEQRNVWVAELEPDGDLAWEQTWDDGEAGDDAAFSVAVDGDGIVRVLALRLDALSPNTVLAFDDSGMPLLDDTIELGDTVFFDFELLANGDALATGIDALGSAVTRFDAEWDQQWAGFGETAQPFAIASDGTERPFVAGSVSTLSAPNAWVGAFHADGQRWWSDSYDNPDANDQDRWWDVAVDGDGDVIVVGEETTLDEDMNALVRKYHPL